MNHFAATALVLLTIALHFTRATQLPECNANNSSTATPPVTEVCSPTRPWVFPTAVDVLGLIHDSATAEQLKAIHLQHMDRLHQLAALAASDPAWPTPGEGSCVDHVSGTELQSTTVNATVGVIEAGRVQYNDVWRPRMVELLMGNKKLLGQLRGRHSGSCALTLSGIDALLNATSTELRDLDVLAPLKTAVEGFEARVDSTSSPREVTESTWCVVGAVFGVLSVVDWVPLAHPTIQQGLVERENLLDDFQSILRNITLPESSSTSRTPSPMGALSTITTPETSCFAFLKRVVSVFVQRTAYPAMARVDATESAMLCRYQPSPELVFEFLPTAATGNVTSEFLFNVPVRLVTLTATMHNRTTSMASLTVASPLGEQWPTLDGYNATEALWRAATTNGGVILAQPSSPPNSTSNDVTRANCLPGEHVAFSGSLIGGYTSFCRSCIVGWTSEQASFCPGDGFRHMCPSITPPWPSARHIHPINEVNATFFPGASALASSDCPSWCGNASTGLYRQVDEQGSTCARLPPGHRPAADGSFSAEPCVAAHSLATLPFPFAGHAGTWDGSSTSCGLAGCCTRSPVFRFVSEVQPSSPHPIVKFCNETGQFAPAAITINVSVSVEPASMWELINDIHNDTFPNSTTAPNASAVIAGFHVISEEPEMWSVILTARIWTNSSGDYLHFRFLFNTSVARRVSPILAFPRAMPGDSSTALLECAIWIHPAKDEMWFDMGTLIPNDAKAKERQSWPSRSLLPLWCPPSSDTKDRYMAFGGINSTVHFPTRTAETLLPTTMTAVPLGMDVVRATITNGDPEDLMVWNVDAIRSTTAAASPLSDSRFEEEANNGTQLLVRVLSDTLEPACVQVFGPPPSPTSTAAPGSPNNSSNRTNSPNADDEARVESVRRVIVHPAVLVVVTIVFLLVLGSVIRGCWWERRNPQQTPASDDDSCCSSSDADDSRSVENEPFQPEAAVVAIQPSPEFSPPQWHRRRPRPGPLAPTHHHNSYRGWNTSQEWSMQRDDESCFPDEHTEPVSNPYDEDVMNVTTASPFRLETMPHSSNRNVFRPEPNQQQHSTSPTTATSTSTIMPKHRTVSPARPPQSPRKASMRDNESQRISTQHTRKMRRTKQKKTNDSITERASPATSPRLSRRSHHRNCSFRAESIDASSRYSSSVSSSISFAPEPAFPNDFDSTA